MTDDEKCGLGSILPMSCRGRAEAFARRLHLRLRSLGSQDDNSSADESSWLGANENPIAISQPRHHHVADSDMYFEFGPLESPASPDEELEESEMRKLLNQDTLKHSHSDQCQCPKAKSRRNNNNTIRSNSNDSDSDGQFYDSEEKISSCCNGDSHLHSTPSTEDMGIDMNSDVSSSQSFATTSDCAQQLQENISVTNSLREEDCSSLETCESLTDVTKSDSSCNEYAKRNGNLSGIENGEQDLPVCAVEITVNGVNSELMEPVNGTENETDDDIEEERPPRVRRCSSLKTGKTPPGTPGRKKIVRFADALGLDLADVRTFLDEIPKVPTSAYEDLSVDLNESTSDNSSIGKFQGIHVDKILMPLFQQPGGLLNFLDLVRENQVCLENAVVDDPLMFSVKGIVRVRNLDFHKSVYIRYTLNSWKSFADVQATYVSNSCDGFSDKFSFILYVHTLSVGQKLEFACRFQCKGCQYWDNNSGKNYCFQCLPATSSTPGVPLTQADEWGGCSFYY